jgi:hypothetical protein
MPVNVFTRFLGVCILSTVWSCRCCGVDRARTRRPSFEGTWGNSASTVRLRRVATGFQATGTYKGRRPAWELWGVSPQVGNSLTFRFRHALPGIAGGFDVKTTRFTLPSDGRHIDVIVYYQIIQNGSILSQVSRRHSPLWKVNAAQHRPPKRVSRIPGVRLRYHESPDLRASASYRLPSDRPVMSMLCSPPK